MNTRERRPITEVEEELLDAVTRLYSRVTVVPDADLVVLVHDLVRQVLVERAAKEAKKHRPITPEELEVVAAAKAYFESWNKQVPQCSNELVRLRRAVERLR